METMRMDEVTKDGSFTSLKTAIRKNPNVLVEKGMTGENRKIFRCREISMRMILPVVPI